MLFPYKYQNSQTKRIKNLKELANRQVKTATQNLMSKIKIIIFYSRLKELLMLKFRNKIQLSPYIIIR